MPQLVHPTYDDICTAAERLRGHAIRTPLLRSAALDALTNAQVFIKPENLQRTGSFKFRGAFNAVSCLSEKDRERGVLAVSSGNHAQGVAAAAGIFSIPATIIMPADAPTSKTQRTRALGAKVVHYDRSSQDREAIARKLQAESGAAFIHPYNDPHVIAGQGTAGLEACDDLKALGKTPHSVLICTGGGGLASGISLAVHAHFPDAHIHTCEPHGFDDYARSLASRRRERNDRTSGSVCDAVLTDTPGEIGFSILSGLAQDGLVVSDEAALRAVAFAYHDLKLVVEPGGAIALACLIENRARFAGQTILLTLSGGNIDAEMLMRALSLPPQG